MSGIELSIEWVKVGVKPEQGRVFQKCNILHLGPMKYAFLVNRGRKLRQMMKKSYPNLGNSDSRVRE